MMDWDRLYARTPRWLQALVLNAQEWRWQRLRFTPEFHALVAEYEARAYAAPEEIARLRDQRLAEFVVHAANTTPYYRDLFARLKLDPRDIRGLADMAALPILRKAEVQQQLDRFRSTVISPRDVIQLHTGGSTRGGLRLCVTRGGHREQWAVWERFFRWYGVGHDAWRLDFNGRPIVPAEQRRPPYWRTNRYGKQIMFSAYHLRRETAGEYLDAMQHTGVSWIHGYPSLVASIAQFAVELSVALPIRHVTLAGERTLPQHERIIAEAFSVKPTQHYGPAEGVANLSQCPAGKLHVDEEFAAVEFVPAGDGAYWIVGTNLSNPAFPLLRYEVGDRAALDGERCRCRRPGRVVRQIDFRQEDNHPIRRL